MSDDLVFMMKQMLFCTEYNRILLAKKERGDPVNDAKGLDPDIAHAAADYVLKVVMEASP